MSLARASAAALVVATLSATAHADPQVNACIAAFDDGQRLRTEGHLFDAHARLLVCAKPECPAVIRSDCANVLGEVDRVQPSIVLGYVDGEGHDVADVRVAIDGKPVATRLDGHAIVVDPGNHVFRFEPAAGSSVETTAVVAEGEKARPIRIVLERAADETRPPLPIGPPPERSVVGWVVPAGFAAIALGGFAVGGIARLNLQSKVDDLANRCGTTCDPNEKAGLHDDLTFANVSVAVGIASAVVAAAMWLVLSPPSSASPRSALAW